MPPPSSGSWRVGVGSRLSFRGWFGGGCEWVVWSEYIMASNSYYCMTCRNYHPIKSKFSNDFVNHPDKEAYAQQEYWRQVEEKERSKVYGTPAIQRQCSYSQICQHALQSTRPPVVLTSKEWQTVFSQTSISPAHLESMAEIGVDPRSYIVPGARRQSNTSHSAGGHPHTSHGAARHTHTSHVLGRATAQRTHL
eukprot:40419-Rhodomonas_salina.1